MTGVGRSRDSSGAAAVHVAYRQLAAEIRESIAAGDYANNRQLPTEAELAASTGLGRQTIRRAFQELVGEGVVYRVRGRGSFAVPTDGRYLRSFGSVADLMALSIDTELEVVEPLHVRADVGIARQLKSGGDLVMAMSFVRLHEGLPFCYTRVFLPLALGREMRALPELTALAAPGNRGRVTVIGLIEQIGTQRIQSALQDVTAEPATSDIAGRLGCDVGRPILRIDRLYSDAGERPVELAVNHFNPDRYSYRLQLRDQSR
jgi:GntR family transcriptional regulator